MSRNLIGPDIQLMRKRYDEALQMQGIPAKYQYPLFAETDSHGQDRVDSYSEMVDTFIFFDGTPRMKTYKRLGWVVENDSNLPFLIHCSYHLESLQRGAIFRIAGMYTGVKDRIFRVTELTTDLQAPDHIIAQVVPVYGDEKDITGRTDQEIKQQFNTSHHFLEEPIDYRGDYVTERPGEQ